MGGVVRLGLLCVSAALVGCTANPLTSIQQPAAPPAAQAAPARLSVVSETMFPSGGAIELVLRSQRLGRNYTVVVSPPSGDFALRGRKLPAIYALDGGYGFAGALGQFMGGSGMMSPAYIVAVGVADADRIYDFIDKPVERDGVVVGGGGAKFREFLLDDLRPYLEGRFPLDPTSSILFGHSLGGASAASLLSQSPKAFSGYIIASPALWASPELPDALAKAASEGASARAFLAVAEKEQAELLQDAELVATALSVPGSRVWVEKYTFPGETHISYLPQLVTKAFGRMLPPPPPVAATRTAISVPPEMLEHFVGVYALEDGRTITITRSGGQIFSQASTSARKAPLLAETSRRFFVMGFDYVVTFEGPEGAPASGLVFRLNGAEKKAIRAAR